MNAVLLPEAIHPAERTYTRGVHSLPANSRKAFCGGAPEILRFDVCLHRNTSFS